MTTIFKHNIAVFALLAIIFGGYLPSEAHAAVAYYTKKGTFLSTQLQQVIGLES